MQTIEVLLGSSQPPIKIFGPFFYDWRIWDLRWAKKPAWMSPKIRQMVIS
jgi:hypothetical protein